MLYRVQWGDSPAVIARKFGVSVAAIIAANRQKPTTVVAGRRTWRSLRPGEGINVPTSGSVGAAADDAKINAINLLIGAGGPCLEKNVALVCAVQTILGLSNDGKWGNSTAAEARQFVPNAPGGCSPRPSWWLPAGQRHCTGERLAPIVEQRQREVFGPPAPAPDESSSVHPALLALMSIDPCDPANAQLVCQAQAVLGKKDGSGLDGKYGSGTAAEVRRFVPNAPPGCSPRPSWWAPAGKSNCGGSPPTPSVGPSPSLPPPVPTPTPVPRTPSPSTPSPVPAPGAGVPPAVAALATFNPCDPANADRVCAAQAALGATDGQGMDGKYGNDTAAKARAVFPGAPPGCSPRPSWWAPAGSSNCSGTSFPPRGASPAPAPAPIPSPTPAPAPAPGGPPTPTPAPAPAPGGVSPTPGGDTSVEVITPPEKKELSTGAIVAGGVGLLALVGIVAVAATKSSTTTTSRTTTRRAPAKRTAPKRKRKTSKRKPKRKKK